MGSLQSNGRRTVSQNKRFVSNDFTWFITNCWVTKIREVWQIAVTFLELNQCWNKYDSSSVAILKIIIFLKEFWWTNSDLLILIQNCNFKNPIRANLLTYPYENAQFDVFFILNEKNESLRSGVTVILARVGLIAQDRLLFRLYNLYSNYFCFCLLTRAYIGWWRYSCTSRIVCRIYIKLYLAWGR